MQNNDIAKVEQRIRRYWYSDGISEITGGLMFLILGGYFGAQDFLEKGSLVRIILQSSLMLVMLAAILSSRWLVNTLKEKLTYPRTGYVAYRVDKQKSRRWRIVVAVVAALIVALSIQFANWTENLSEICFRLCLVTQTSFAWG